MRVPLTALLLVTLLFSSLSRSFALSSDQGKTVKGRYFGSGLVTAPGIKIQYLPSRVSVNAFGRMRGTITRQVVSNSGAQLESGPVSLNGRVRSLRTRGASFTASAIVRLSDGAVFQGTFSGLTAPNLRLSRFFRGKISGNSGSSFQLRAR